MSLIIYKKKEINDFLENLTQAQFTAIQKFFASMPKLTHDVKLTHPKTKKKGKVRIVITERYNPLKKIPFLKNENAPMNIPFVGVDYNKISD